MILVCLSKSLFPRTAKEMWDPRNFRIGFLATKCRTLQTALWKRCWTEFCSMHPISTLLGQAILLSGNIVSMAPCDFSARSWSLLSGCAGSHSVFHHQTYQAKLVGLCEYRSFKFESGKLANNSIELQNTGYLNYPKFYTQILKENCAYGRLREIVLL